MAIDNLLQKVKAYNPNADVKLIQKAYEFADAAHINEQRLNGEPLIDHCLTVASLLADLKVDSATIATALLHDVIEHTNITKKDLEKEFGRTVADLVDGVTVIKKVKTKTGEYRQTDNLRKLLLATAKDVRVVLIRLAEKLDSLKKIDGLPESLRKETAQKALDIYAPLAERLGVHHFKWQLEDWAFKYLDHNEHSRIQNFLAETREEREAYINRVKETLLAELKKEGIKAEIYGRPKHFYSIYKKSFSYREPGETMEDYLKRLHDIHALRVLVDTVDDCYKAGGALHQLWKPWGRYQDYIAKPKPNGYRSIHTSVYCLENKIAECQIRTYEMHEYNELGPASHIYYKEVGREKGSLRKAPVDRLVWLKNLVEWQEEVKGEKEFEQALRIDVFGERIFVLTPKGDVLDLPKGATPVDFACAVHSDLGNSCVGAKVNGKLVPLNCELRTNQVIEILTSKTRKKPSPDWLKFVKTQEAKSQIRKALRVP